MKLYEDYCGTRDDYENNQAVFAIENIKENYKMRMKNGKFLRFDALLMLWQNPQPTGEQVFSRKNLHRISKNKFPGRPPQVHKC